MGVADIEDDDVTGIVGAGEHLNGIRKLIANCGLMLSNAQTTQEAFSMKHIFVD
jgi:hypothetical protein